MNSTIRTISTLLLFTSTLHAQAATSILFIGNSFTFGQGSAVRYHHPESVTDLNNLGIGGVPALFKSFTRQAGLDYDVYLETQPGSGLEFHIENRLAQIGRRPWDTVVMHGQSTLDFSAPGNADKLVSTSREIADIFYSRIQMWISTLPPLGRGLIRCIAATAPGQARQYSRWPWMCVRATSWQQTVWRPSDQ